MSSKEAPFFLRAGPRRAPWPRKRLAKQERLSGKIRASLAGRAHSTNWKEAGNWHDHASAMAGGR
jgi:hypothetical protein